MPADLISGRRSKSRHARFGRKALLFLPTLALISCAPPKSLLTMGAVLKADPNYQRDLDSILTIWQLPPTAKWPRVNIEGSATRPTLQLVNPKSGDLLTVKLSAKRESFWITSDREIGNSLLSTTDYIAGQFEGLKKVHSSFENCRFKLDSSAFPILRVAHQKPEPPRTKSVLIYDNNGALLGYVYLRASGQLCLIHWMRPCGIKTP
jgi:hypothetical protein